MEISRKPGHKWMSAEIRNGCYISAREISSSGIHNHNFLKKARTARNLKYTIIIIRSVPRGLSRVCKGSNIVTIATVSVNR